MAEYINKDKLIKAFYDEMQSMKNTDRSEAADKVFGILMRYVNSFEASDVQSIKHGWWIEEEPRVLKCSVCGEYAPMNYLGQNCIDSRYCPWCGTKMDSNADEPWQSE